MIERKGLAAKQPTPFLIQINNKILNKIKLK